MQLQPSCSEGIESLIKDNCQLQIKNECSSYRPHGLTISLKDAYGNPEEGSMTFIALVMQPYGSNYYKETALVANYTTHNNNASIGFNLTRNADAIICSAQKNDFAYGAAARNNSTTGFNLGLLDYDGNAGTSVWTSWMAFGFK